MEKYLKRAIIFLILLFVAVGVLIFIKGAKTFSVVSTGDSLFDPSKDKRWDILILGNRGETAPSGGVLTDSVMVLSYQGETKKAAIFSIPRDLWVEIPGYGYEKINYAYAAGFNSTGDSKKGIKLAKEVVKNVTGLDIDFVLVIDVEGLKEIVDAVGGITIYEDKYFYENFYGHPVQIYPGQNHLNGDEVMGYVGMRRYDSDFQRMRRQQKVILALKDKILSSGTFLNPDKLWQIFNATQKHIRTDLNASQIRYLIQNASKFEVDSVEQVVFDTENYLYASYSPQGAYILIPKSGDFSQIKEVFQNVFEEGKSQANETEMPTFEEEKINKVGN